MAFSLALILLVAAAHTLVGRPPRRWMPLIILSWLTSWLAQSFAPWLALGSLLLAAWTWRFGAADAYSTTTALAALAAALLFTRIHLLGHRAGRAVERIVDEAVAAYAGRPHFRSPGQNLRWAGLRPFKFGRKSVRRTRDIAYGGDDSRQRLDIYQPLVTPEAPMPVLIQVPGGGWVAGSKGEQGLPLLHYFAARGWTCFSINYRLAPGNRFPRMLEDVLRAVAWVKAHAEEYGADAGFVAITGGSAGGHLASLAALVQERSALQPGFELADTRVSAAVPIYGRYDFINRHDIMPEDGLVPFLTQTLMPGSPQEYPELWDIASPESQVHAGAPPFLVIHGSRDSLIPVEEAREFARALQGASEQAVVYAELPGAEHAFDMVCSSWSMHTIRAVYRYLESLHANYAEAQQQ